MYAVGDTKKGKESLKDMAMIKINLQSCGNKGAIKKLYNADFLENRIIVIEKMMTINIK